MTNPLDGGGDPGATPRAAALAAPAVPGPAASAAPPAVDPPPRVIVDERWGYRRLDPLPPADEAHGFYESHYGGLVAAGGRATDLARLLAGGPDADAERAWLTATLHADVLAALGDGASEGLPRRVVDIGCGTGEMVRALLDAGWDAVGTEPSTALADAGRARGVPIVAATATAFLADHAAAGGEPFGAAVLLNVLEHVREPAGLLAALHAALAPGARLVVRVPNDFSPLQLAAHRALGGEPWWVVAPDHLNYFDHRSLARLVEGHGFQVVEQSADFPMELFLLMGDDYRADPAAGAAAHRRRRRMEMALDPETRRALGRGWASAGMGRNAFLVARREPA